MFCGTRSPHRTAGAAALHARALGVPAAPRTNQVFGTWDFKWPQGHQIRVAFQRPPQPMSDADLRSVIAQTTRLAASWLAPPPGGSAPNVSFTFLTDEALWWPAPPAGGTSRSASMGKLPDARYDVLVSFATLPIAEPETPDHDNETAILPRSQLGAYARRRDLGVPTVYLGRPTALEGTPATDAAYFAGARFNHCVVHEFGHVLGLAHEHQNPRAAPQWKPVPEIADILDRRLTGLAKIVGDAQKQGFLELFAHSQIQDPWPASAVDDTGVRFSDWRAPVRAGGEYDFDSTMVDPIWKCCLASAGKLSPAEEDLLIDPVFTVQAPTESDLRHVGAMYPRR